MSEPQPFTTDRISDLVQLCLAAIVTAAASFDPAIDLPQRQIAGAGTIPYDCEQVVVNLIQVGTGTPEPTGAGFRAGAATYPNPGSNITLYQATVALAIVRCTSTTPPGPRGQGIPTPDAYLANLTAASTDAAVLLAALDTLGQTLISATPRTVTAGIPAGGLVATSARVNLLV